MRSNAIRHALTGPASRKNASVALNQLQSSFPNFWQKCFQRAFARSFHRLPRMHPCGVLAPPASIPTSVLIHLGRRQKILESLVQQHQPKRTYGQPATSVFKKVAKAHNSVRRQSTPQPALVSISRRANEEQPDILLTARSKMNELQGAIKGRDLQTTFKCYQELRSRGTFSTSTRNSCYSKTYLFRTLSQLIQLIHRARLELTVGLSPLPSSQYRHTKQLQKLSTQRRQVLKDIEPYVRTESRTMGYLTLSQRRLALVDAMAESKARVELSFTTGSKTYLKDRREALKVLEDWALATPEPKKVFVAQTGVAHSEDIATILEQDLARGVTKLMRLLVHSHTFLVRSLLETIPENFGISTTVGMHVVLLRYYSMFGRDGYQDTMSVFTQMDRNPSLNWRQEPVVYDFLMYALSHLPGNEPKAEKLIQEMLSQDITPRATTMKAAILCAARSGDLEACSRYIARMQRDWNLSLSERMKAILLYACAKRGDFDGAMEIMEQLDHSGSLVQDKSERNGSTSKVMDGRKNRDGKSNDPVRVVQITEGTINPTTAPSTDTADSKFVTPKMLDMLSSDDIINNSNILLALINQTRVRRRRMDKTSSEMSAQRAQAFLKEEVSKVLELFTLITKDPEQTDTQLYTIMMQYLSTLPSPLPGMMYLYREMQASEQAKPNAITYKILLEACAEQMDMEQGRELWEQMKEDNIQALGFVRASYVKGWGRAGYLQTAEWFAREGLALQRAAKEDNEVLWWKMKYGNDGGTRRFGRRERSLLKTFPTSPTSPNRQQLPALQIPELINLTVLHELMRANRLHNRPKRVVNIFKQIDAGKWGLNIQPNQHTLSIVLQACSSPVADSRCVNQAVNLVERFLKKLKDRLEPRRIYISSQQAVLSSRPPSTLHQRHDSNSHLGLDKSLSSNTVEDPSKTTPVDTTGLEQVPQSYSAWSSWWASSHRALEDDQDIEPDPIDNNSQDGYLEVDIGDDDDVEDGESGSIDSFSHRFFPERRDQSYSKTRTGSAPCLSSENYEYYLTMLAQHHRQEKMVEVWDAMMAAYASMDLSHAVPDTENYDFTSIASKHEHRYRGPPRVQSVNIIVEALENVQWGVQPIRKIQKDLETYWPDQDWSLAGRMRCINGVGGSQSVHAQETPLGAGENDLNSEPKHLGTDFWDASKEEVVSVSSGFGEPRSLTMSRYRDRSDRRFLDVDEDDVEDEDGFLAAGAGGRFWK